LLGVKKWIGNRDVFGLKWKIGGIYTGVMLVLGAFVIGAVYQLTQSTLRDQLDRRALAIATNFSDATAGYIAGRNLLALHALARKYTLLDGVAYAFVQDRREKSSLIPLELSPRTSARTFCRAKRQVHRRELLLADATVYETAVPVLEDSWASSMWVLADAVQKEIRGSLVPVIGIVAIVPSSAALLSFLLAHWIVRPIVGLTQIADKVTMGDLETSVGGECVTSRDEIGDLARSLERMRSSLKAAMLRLGREIA
jgi:HAMP domain-containing protein